jgi:hypothetical protein
MFNTNYIQKNPEAYNEWLLKDYQKRLSAAVKLKQSGVNVSSELLKEAVASIKEKGIKVIAIKDNAILVNCGSLAYCVLTSKTFCEPYCTSRDGTRPIYIFHRIFGKPEYGEILIFEEAV